MASSQDLNIVGIYSGSTLLFEKAKIMKAQVKETSQMMNHPVESGTVVTDHKIINPIEITIPLMVSSADYRSVYNSIRKVFLESDFLTIQTKSGIYKNMLISNMPHDESPDAYNALMISLQLKEVFIVTALTVGVTGAKHSKDATDKNTGVQSGKQKTSSILAGWFK